MLQNCSICILAWLLLIHPTWLHGGPPLPISQWQSFGSFNSKQICEFYRGQFIAEREGASRGLLKKFSVCVPDAAVDPTASDAGVGAGS